MSNEENPQMPLLSTKHLPLSRRDMDKNNKESPPARSVWRTVFKYLPFGLHFALTAVVATVCLRIINGRSFNITSRRPQYVEVDGSLSHLTSYAPLQSDIVTAVSLAATATRVAGGWWAAGYVWRGIFMAMEGGGISLEGLSRVLSSLPPAPRHFARRTHMIVIFVTLVATFAIDYFSAVLTGSFIWEATDRLIPGQIPLLILNGMNSTSLAAFLGTPNESTLMAAQTCASASLAWADLNRNSSNITEPSTVIRRVVPFTQYLSVNSILANVTVPFFTVDAFEWVHDPDAVLTKHQLPLISNQSDLGLLWYGGLLPDSQWGPSNTTSVDPHIVSETRLFILPVSTEDVNVSCPQNYAIDDATINLHAVLLPGNYSQCYAIANMTYRAGAAICYNCSLIFPTVLDAHGPLSLIPDSITSLALSMTPFIATSIIYSGYAIPVDNYETGKAFIIDTTSRAYQASWASISDRQGVEVDSTAVDIALPTLRAKIILWRVYLWVGLHVGVLVLGLLFVYMQSHYTHPWVEDTTMAIFWLDTREVIDSDKQGVDPWQRGSEIRRKGMLVLDEAGQGSRSVKVKRA